MTEELRAYIESTTPVNGPLDSAYEAAQEFGLPTPDVMTGSLLSALAASCQAQAAIAVTPAASVVGLHVLKGMNPKGILTCIDPDPENHNRAKATFRDAGYSPSRIRFLPSRPLDVMSRLAAGSYQLVYGEVSPIDVKAFVDIALPLLSSGGSVVLPDVLLDGTIADESRKDRVTVAAREADEYLRSLDGIVVARLPLGAGTTVITKA